MDCLSCPHCSCVIVLRPKHVLIVCLRTDKHLQHAKTCLRVISKFYEWTNLKRAVIQQHRCVPKTHRFNNVPQVRFTRIHTLARTTETGQQNYELDSIFSEKNL